MNIIKIMHKIYMQLMKEIFYAKCGIICRENMLLYKYLYNEDAKKFAEIVKNRDKNMVDLICEKNVCFCGRVRRRLMFPSFVETDS